MNPEPLSAYVKRTQGDCDGQGAYWLADEIQVLEDALGHAQTTMTHVRRVEDELLRLIDLHHRTLKGSQGHDPEKQDWPACPCKTCSRVAALLPRSAASELERLTAQRS